MSHFPRMFSRPHCNPKNSFPPQNKKEVPLHSSKSPGLLQAASMKNKNTKSAMIWSAPKTSVVHDTASRLISGVFCPKPPRGSRAKLRESVSRRCILPNSTEEPLPPMQATTSIQHSHRVFPTHLVAKNCIGSRQRSWSQVRDAAAQVERKRKRDQAFRWRRRSTFQ